MKSKKMKSVIIILYFVNSLLAIDNTTTSNNQEIEIQMKAQAEKLIDD